MYSVLSGRAMCASVSRPSQHLGKFSSQAVVTGPEHSHYQHRPYNNRHKSANGFPGAYRAPPRLVTDTAAGTSASLMPSAAIGAVDTSVPIVPSNESMAPTEVTAPDATSAAAVDQSEQPLTNTKEKTPMCLINELARFNKVQHQYCLTDEQGPAHKKTFFVRLKLGDEEFAASGASIKKAQHAAAAVALEQTKYQHPAPKRPMANAALSVSKTDANSSITPTVELNALAMKRGELAIYRPFERKVSAPPPYYVPPFDFRGGCFSQRYRFVKPTHRYCVALKVGEREFIGEGETMQAARHSAASMALKLLRSLPMPTREVVSPGPGDGSVEETPVKGNELLKSEISLVHEIALKRSFSVEFEMMKESGPPHMRTYVTHCKCGTLVTEGEGGSKKLSKKVAAEKMVAELKKLPPLPPAPPSLKPKKNFAKSKQSKNLIKNVSTLSTIGINPISRLIQIQQAKKEKEPSFSLVAENGAPRCREFVVQVTVGDNVCSGVGPNKKLAKRNAAEQMLQLLGYALSPPPPSKPALKAANDVPGVPVVPPAACGDKRVTFVDAEPQQARSVAVRGPAVGIETTGLNGDVITADVEQPVKAVECRPSLSRFVPSPVRSFDQLKYLAKVLGIEIQVTNVPKDNKFLSVVTLCTNPPQFYNGTGPTTDAAVDGAALSAIQKLSEVGLDADTGQQDNRAAV